MTEQSNVVAKAPDFVDTSLQLSADSVKEAIAQGTVVYLNTMPVKLLVDVDGDGNHILYRATQVKRFGMAMATQFTTKPVAFVGYKVDGNEFPAELFNIREMSAATEEELAAMSGVLKLTVEDGAIKIEQVRVNKEAK